MALPYQFSAKTIIQERRIDQTVVEEIKNWLHTTSLPDLQDELIVLFLLSCESDFTATQHKIQAYFIIRNRAPDLFGNLEIDNEGVVNALKVVTYCSVPRRLNNTLIILARLNDTNYRNLVLADAFKIAFMLVDVNQMYNPPDDIIAIVDMQGLTFMHLTCLKLNVLKNFIDYLQDGMPLKIKKVHILNTNYVAQKVIVIARMFMRKEQAELLQVHSSRLKLEEFHQEWVPCSYLPKEYGGDLPSCEELHEKTVLQLQKMKLFFETEERLVNSYKDSK